MYFWIKISKKWLRNDLNQSTPPGCTEKVEMLAHRECKDLVSCRVYLFRTFANGQNKVKRIYE